jgi:hypothetical protein
MKMFDFFYFYIYGVIFFLTCISHNLKHHILYAKIGVQIIDIPNFYLNGKILPFMLLDRNKMFSIIKIE